LRSIGDGTRIKKIKKMKATSWVGMNIMERVMSRRRRRRVRRGVERGEREVWRRMAALST